MSQANFVYTSTYILVHTIANFNSTGLMKYRISANVPLKIILIDIEGKKLTLIAYTLDSASL
jgi:hypothetical protein